MLLWAKYSATCKMFYYRLCSSLLFSIFSVQVVACTDLLNLSQVSVLVVGISKYIGMFFIHVIKIHFCWKHLHHYLFQDCHSYWRSCGWCFPCLIQDGSIPWLMGMAYSHTVWSESCLSAFRLAHRVFWPIFEIHNALFTQYLSPVLASILGVVPFLGTYWACIPAVLELWLAQGCSMLAVAMILAFYIPTSWVNGLVYEEIKGWVSWS